MRLFLKYWLPVILWMLIIFSFSSDTISSQRSSRIIGPIVHWLFPNKPPKDVEGIVFLVETFSGKRNYYACVADTSSLEGRIEPLRASYPQHTISVAAHEGKAWKFYNGYRQDFPWKLKPVRRQHGQPLLPATRAPKTNRRFAPVRH